MNNFTIGNPIRVQFEVSKGIYGSLNNMVCKIFNLERSHATLFIKDAEEQKKIKFTLSVGYQNELTTIFIGDIFRGFQSKQGNDVVVSCEVLDTGFGYINGFVCANVETSQKVIDEIIKNTQGLSIGQITKMPELVRNKILVGNSGKLIQQLVDPTKNWFIDNGKLYIISQNEYLKGLTPIVTASTGLLNTPERENRLVSFETMLNPAIKLGGLCDLQSSTADYLNGVYRVEQVITRGDNYGQDWKQTIVGRIAQGFSEL